ncbi:MAG: hypothetical protein DKM50_02475 [Candidatus Margulisiibacteriota bacterium]|nr:MAG: hypothetical protein A2X43_03745 [Candidatus Margulisbacteria bacterium GWD2_39_127]OGI02473.1 MAG: hypothetical protein A2X42_07300 [Candidatus Margulisbacteria bacterium GWF2_38_17]OGI10966.1 MAG: hypothetical protein A2X41_01825 [Candidatus Margulisbacteria bacterium GWE2_39_32]PZM83160.1 MAG: hypothetical protein DKM50_02475 [Candidatus Margulisiibacteriota bacterium]HAR62538.1 hypothetical protein [Candidatus Margulisiibacteriota bacterium]
MLKGKFVNLRNMLIEDIPMITKWFMENELSVFYISTSLASTEEVKAYFEGILKNPAKRRDFIITGKKDNIPLGMISIENINWVHRNASLSFFLGVQGERKREYARESYILCLDYAFSVINLHRVEMKILASNKPLLKLFQDWSDFYLKDGLESIHEHEATLKEAAFFMGEYTDFEIYAVFKERYKKLWEKTHTIIKELYSTQQNKKVT